jgi:hypothetical protein
MKYKKKLFYSIVSLIFILLIVAVFLPSIISNRKNAPIWESCNKMDEIVRAEFKFYRQNGKYGTLKQLAEADLLDNKTSEGENFGYKFSIVVKENGFELDAFPVNYESFSDVNPQSFYSDERGIVWSTIEKGQRATEQDNIMSCEKGRYGTIVCGTRQTKEDCLETIRIKP